MPGWLSTTIISLILAIIVAMIIISMIRDKKKGRSVCSCGGDCSMCHACSGSCPSDVKHIKQP